MAHTMLLLFILLKETTMLYIYLLIVIFFTTPAWSQQELSKSINNNKNEIVTFALVPQQSASKLAKKWIPIFKYLTKKTGIQISFRTAPNIPAFEAKLADGEYDIAYMNPYHYTAFSKEPGYLAFAKAKDKKIKGILVTSKANPVLSFEQLHNQTLAFPAPTAFAATLLTQAALNKNQITYQSKYVSSHDSVYHNVAKGIYPAGGGILRTFGNISPEIRDKLKIFYTTNGYTPHAFAAHPRIDKKLISKLQNAMAMMDTEDEGRELLKSINIKGIDVAKNSDWDDVRQLNINIKLD